MNTSTAPAWVHQKALEVARRFTQDTEPQRRASLQIAVAEAMVFVRPELASSPQQAAAPAADGSTPGEWRVEKRERDGELVACWVAAPDCNGFAYAAEILGDDEYRDGDEAKAEGMPRRLADCELIVKAVAAYRAQPQAGKVVDPVGAASPPANDVRMAFLHSTNKDADGYEWGVAKVRFGADGKPDSVMWGASDHSDIDAAMPRHLRPDMLAAEFAAGGVLVGGAVFGGHGGAQDAALATQATTKAEPPTALPVVEQMTWPTMPRNRHQSLVLFEDGYAEGWAKCLDQCKAAFALAISGTQAARDAQTPPSVPSAPLNYDQSPLETGEKDAL